MQTFPNLSSNRVLLNVQVLHNTGFHGNPNFTTLINSEEFRWLARHAKKIKKEKNPGPNYADD